MTKPFVSIPAQPLIQSRMHPQGRGLLLVLFAAVLCLALPAGAGAARTPARPGNGAFRGRWSGASGHGEAAFLTLINSDRTFRFTGQDSCSIELKEPSVSTDTELATVVDTVSGGDCAAMWSGRIHLSKTGDDTLTFTLRKSDGALWDQGTLQRVK
ncbi:hypothetical protein dsx2_1986 [Desulfovibrio sp. X2]|uniref:hypothetical protein n=1 Tax=Desulfovibrio sp. X2 TaxID=941449 RepID=UPI000358CA9E|nr:hypothetical protein [Desulfovibrio sp. X2]EPR43947.1 hypothetical protein dsx2_1986 [Desulfovibrio sp. X2]